MNTRHPITRGLTLMVAFCFVLTTAPSSLLAQMTDQSKDFKEMQEQATRLDGQASQSQQHGAVFESISKQLNVPVETLQAEQKSTNFGFGQLFIANALATASGKSFDTISAEFKSGRGWGEIAKEDDVKLGTVVSGLKRVNKQVEQARMERTRASGSSVTGRTGSRGSAHASQQGVPRSHVGGQANRAGKR